MSKKFIAAAVAPISFGIGVGSQKAGIATPERTIGERTGILGQTDIPGVGELPDISTDLDQAAIDAAREGELERISKRKGRASTITKKPKGILGAETTGQLLGG